MRLVDKNIKIDELKKISIKMFGGLIKAVVDVQKEVMVIDGEMHADEEKFLLDTGSKQDNLWGINIYPNMKDNDFIEFDSVINLRPRLNNFSRGINDEIIRKKIISIVNKLIKK